MQLGRGILRKMRATLSSPIEYRIPLSNDEVKLTQQLGKSITLDFSGKIFCIQCERKITKSFQQGYCYPCYRRLLECNLCIIHPERCLVEQGKCPETDWAHAQCHQQHIIYLANTSGLKVGITRKTQTPTRWIDQGAVQAIPLFEVENRYRAGVLEVALKSFVNDKTNWRTMLKNEAPVLDLTVERDRLLRVASEELAKFSGNFIQLDEKPISLTYPVTTYPEKITSLSLDKTPRLEAKLLGIKGQYLLLDSGVINLRKFGGYEVEVTVE